MAWAEAARNVADSYRFQLSLGGDLPARISYASLYWANYFFAKYAKGVAPDQLTSWALKRLAETGRTQRRVQVRLKEGLTLELDQLTCFMILKELARDRIYAGTGADFPPRAGETVFDVGAQQGVFTTLSAREVGASGKVVAFEPEPGNFALLEKNIALNSVAQARALALALSDKPGTATLHRSAFNTGGHSLETGTCADGIAVRVSTLDLVVAENKLPKPDFLKIDVEGSALAILRGGLKTLRASKPRVALELDRLGDAAAAKALLAPLGYRVETRGNNLFAR